MEIELPLFAPSSRQNNKKDAQKIPWKFLRLTKVLLHIYTLGQAFLCTRVEGKDRSLSVSYVWVYTCIRVHTHLVKFYSNFITLWGGDIISNLHIRIIKIRQRIYLGSYNGRERNWGLNNMYCITMPEHIRWLPRCFSCLGHIKNLLIFTLVMVGGLSS